ncbi:MAG: hypothetical protein S4CHLAM2_07290 [Chlamydiales bacterium]|nr:hypothetical protein [Chlamydiales bacterium]
MKLPLIEFTKSLFPNGNALKRTCILSLQHILETTHSMFQALYAYDLDPENVCILGKCYSTNEHVAKRMQQEGIYVSSLSGFFDSHCSYDFLLDKIVLQFLVDCFKRKRDYDRYIVLDDGGHLLSGIIRYFDHLSPKIVGIEQTSSGYEKLKHCTLPFPVLNIANLSLKKKREPSWIAQLVLEQIVKRYPTHQLDSKHILILGNGALGSAFHHLLKDAYHVTVYEKMDPLRPNLAQLLPEVDLIIGCTGVTSLPKIYHDLLKKGCLLASASSSDREFDSVHFRKNFPSYSNCHFDLDTGRVHLINSGFPLNFTGDKHSVNPEKIQLIRALLMSGILQAGMLQEHTPGYISFDDQIQSAIGEHFANLLVKS